MFVYNKLHSVETFKKPLFLGYAKLLHQERCVRISKAIYKHILLFIYCF
jgi:hypothetical protein